MLRACGALLHRSGMMQPSLAGACGYATKQAQPQDFSLVLKAAGEVTSAAQQVPVPHKEVAYASGAPLDVFDRQAHIFSPAKTASQSGWAKTNHNSSSAPAWKLVFDSTEKWQNPLMGWTSTADQLENVGRATLSFYTKDEAIRFCDKHGWRYTVTEPNARRSSRQKRYNSYGDNFSVKRKGLPDLSHLPSMVQK